MKKPTKKKIWKLRDVNDYETIKHSEEQNFI